jgi:hypothetical protein
MVSSFRVLDSASPAELADWLALWHRWDGAEPFAHPTYLEGFLGEGERACCAVLVADEATVLYPFILRSLRMMPWTRKLGDHFDLVGPYGYGGAFQSRELPDCGLRFWREMACWCQARGVVSSFVRLSLFPDQVLPFAGEVARVSQNVVRTLGLTEEECWRDYDHKVRKNVRRAREAGLRCVEDPAGDRLDEYMAVYHGTMQRRSATTSYLFPREFYERLLHDRPGCVRLFHVLQGDRVVSTELVLVSSSYIYSFLGGTLEEAFPLRANDLLKHEIIGWGRQQGKAAFVLGGGYAPDDGVFRYKRSFAPGGVVPFYVGRAVHDSEVFAALVEARQRYERDLGREWVPRPGFFPDYRA